MKNVKDVGDIYVKITFMQDLAHNRFPGSVSFLPSVQNSVFTERLLHTRHCARYWVDGVE